MVNNSSNVIFQDLFPFLPNIQGAYPPSDFGSLAELEDRLLDFQESYQEIAQPFEWKFTQKDLSKMLEELHYHNQVEPERALVCA